MALPLIQSGGGGGGAAPVTSVFTRTGAVVAAANDYSFSQISGSVAATQLPNPSATTLGGIESLASVASKWINTISTSGVPSATQPAASDLSVAALANGITATTQAALDNSTKLATTAYADAAVTASTLTIASPGYLMMPWERYSTVANYVTTALAANAVWGFVFNVRDTITITAAQAVVAANTAATITNFYAGIYNLAGNLLIEFKFPVTSNQVGVITATLAPASFKLTPGTYIYAFGSELSVGTFTLGGFEMLSGATLIAGALNTKSTRIGFKTAMISAGHLVGSGLTQAAMTASSTQGSLMYCLVSA